MGLFGKRDPLYDRLDEYYKWLYEEAERQRQRQEKEQDPDVQYERRLDEQLEKWKEDARKANGWKK